MRSLVLVLAALLVATAAWFAIGSEPAPPGVAPHDDSAPPAAAPEPRVPPTAAGKVAPARDAEIATTESRAPAPPPTASAPSVEPGAQFVVVDEAGEPIEFAKVQAFAGEHDLATARTNERGIATLRRVPPDAKHRVSADGYWPLVGDGCAASTTTRVVMRRAALLTGVVFDAAGAPVGGAHVYLLRVLPGRMSAHVETTTTLLLSPDLLPWRVVTDAGGRFEDRWPDEDAHDLVVVAKGCAHAVVPALRFGTQGETPVIVRLQPAASVDGVALRADGLPLVGVLVEVSTVRAGSPTGVGTLGPPSVNRADQRLSRAFTQARGEFVVGDLPAGPAVVTLANPHAAASVLTTLVAGRTTHVELRAEENATVSGEVQGVQLESAKVFLYGGPAALREGSTVDGKFVFDDVPPGRYLVGAVRGDLGNQVAAVVQDFLVNGSTTFATTVDLTSGERRRVMLPAPVPANGGVTGTASVGGAPASGCVVWIEPLTGPRTHRREGIVDAAGEFRIESVPPGDYDAHLHRIGDPKVIAEVRCRVRGGETSPVTLAAP